MKSDKKIVLIGCGKIGSRHLQAIVKIKGNLRIEIVEPNEESQRIAKMRLSEIDFSKEKICIKWIKDIKDVSRNPDLTIVATTAKGRSEIICNLIQLHHKRFLIEKIVCQSIEEYKRLITFFHRYKAKGWINCARRYWPFYSKIINLFKKEEGPIILSVTAGNLGLGCNAIHFLDLFTALVQNSREIQLNGDYLYPKLLPNPRGDEFVEFGGTIVGKLKDNFVLINFHPHNYSGAFAVIFSKNIKVVIDEESKKAFIASKGSNWQWKNYFFKEMYTSILTTQIAESIIENDDCELPTLQDLYHVHKELFQIFNQHIKLLNGEEVSFCPIT